MPSLLVTVFILQLAIHLINTIGASSINDLLWLVYTKLPFQNSKNAGDVTRLRREVVRVKREMDAISSQDQFAKWAKVRRQYDKVKEEHDKKAASVDSTKSSFQMYATGTRWLTTNGLKLFLQFWHTKTPIYQFPRGWVPWYVEWVLAFPRAPSGSISIQVWGAACGIVISLVGEVLIPIMQNAGVQTSGMKKKQPLTMAAGGSDNGRKEL